MLRALLFAACLLFPASTSAQSFSTIYFFGGYSQPDVADLNSRFQQLLEGGRYNYGTVPEDFGTWGLGMRIGDTRLRFGWDVQYTRRSANNENGTREGESIEAQLSGTQIVFDVNYGILTGSGGRFVLAPTVGIGYEEVSVDLRIANSPDTFDEALTGPGQGVELTRYNVLLDAALQADYALSFDPEFDEVARILTLRIGYRLAPFGLKWRASTGELGGDVLDDGPDFTFGGPYIRLAFGL